MSRAGSIDGPDLSPHNVEASLRISCRPIDLIRLNGEDLIRFCALIS
jgi:hypothetical protein